MSSRQPVPRRVGSGILFTIYTYLTPIGTLAADYETCRRLYAHLHSLPLEAIAYRSMAAHIDVLMTYLY